MIDSSWTLFLDRDGVINKKIDGYIKDPSDFIFIEGIPNYIKKLNSIFKYIIIVTNQQGVGKGLMSTSDLYSIHSFMISQIESFGGHIDHIFVCPHLENDNCLCRKPLPGMAFAAKNLFPEINFEKSIMVGDSLSDKNFYLNSGINKYFISMLDLIIYLESVS